MDSNLIEDYFQDAIFPVIKEYQFDKFFSGRKFRSDFAILPYGILIEYEGMPAGFGGKSRHTSVKGYSEDVNKYRLATLLGYTVLRYTRYNAIEDLEKDLTYIIQTSHGNNKHCVPNYCVGCGAEILSSVSLLEPVVKMGYSKFNCLWCRWKTKAKKKELDKVVNSNLDYSDFLGWLALQRKE